MEACTAWSFRGFSCCLKCSKLCNWYFQRWNCESSDRRTKESKFFCFIGPRYICLPSNYGESLNYQVAPAKTGLISRGEITRCHGNSCTCATENVSDLGRGLFSFEFPAQIETSASREESAVRKACWYYFLPNSKRAVSIMSLYGHRRVSFYKPLVIVRSLAHNIYKFWIRIAFNGLYQRYNSYTMANICEDSAWIWIMNMNIKYLTKLKLNSRFCRRSNRREERWIAAKVQIMVKKVQISGW
jgi:hypothetical protein